MTDDQMWAEVAKNLYEAIGKIDKGAPFEQFNFIMLHNIYLLSSLLYYQYYVSPMQDYKFDKLCRYLLDHYEEVKAVVRNPETTLVKNQLSAGTGFQLKMTPIWWNILLHYRRLMPDELETVRGVFIPKDSVPKRKQMSFFD